MAEKKVLNARIKLKYDEYANWSATANQFKLEAGEVAVTSVPNAIDPVRNAPTIMFKVGDGTKTYNQLGWASALAADVYPWAKADKAPVVNITAGSDIVHINKDEATNVYSISVDKQSFVDTNTLYRVKLSGHTLTLEKSDDGSSWATQDTLTLPDNNTTYTFNSTATSGANFKVTPSGGTAQTVYIDGLGSAAFKADTYFATADAVANIESSLGSAVEAGIAELDATITGMAAGKTLATLTQKDGKIAATFQDIEIAQSQVSGLGTALSGKQDNLAFEGVYNASTNKVATKSYVDGEIAKIDQFKYIVSTSAATTPAGVVWYNGATKVTGTLVASASTEYTIYLVPCKHSAAQEQDGYDEYLTVKSGSAYSWEILGNTRDIDLSGYVPTSRKVNNKALTGDITLSASDVGVTEAAFPGLNKVGTVTGVKMNGSAVAAADGVVDLGTVITAHQDISGKQDKLSTDQLAAVNSGITKAKVTTYDGYATGKQDKLSAAQLEAVNSGITETKVGTYDGYASKISALEGKPGLDKVGTVTSVSTTANGGLKVTNGTTAAVVDIDDSIVFVLDCGSATVNV